MKKVKLLYEKFPQEMEKAAEILIEEGWEPIGGPSVTIPRIAALWAFTRDEQSGDQSGTNTGQGRWCPM